MRIIYDLDEMTETARGWLAGGSVGLVPINGNLHAGHLALVRSSLNECEISIVCIFENNLQFESNETLTRIPLRLDANLQVLDQERIDIVFIPRPYDFYPAGFSTHVVPFGPVAERLEGAIQPENIRKIATSMTKLFQLVRPDKVYLGQKKAQQIVLIRKLVSDLNIDLDTLAGTWTLDFDGHLVSIAQCGAVDLGHGSSGKRCGVERLKELADGCSQLAFDNSGDLLMRYGRHGILKTRKGRDIVRREHIRSCTQQLS